MSNEPKLSVLIVAHNEARHLPDCLEACTFADEIVVVLDRTTDRSADIARAAGATVLTGDWPLEADRRNYGIEQTRYDWILEVDADERPGGALVQEFRTLLNNRAPGYFGVEVRNHIGGRYVKYGWAAYNGVNQSNRLFHRDCKRWDREIIHPSMALSGVRHGVVGHLDHFVDDDVADLIARLNRYTSAAAAEALASGTRVTAWKSFTRFFSRSYKSYIARGGWREGYLGVLLGLFAGLYPVLIYMKTRERE